MGFGENVKKFFVNEDNDEVIEVRADDEDGYVSKYEEASSSAVDGISSETKMVIFEPRCIDDAKEIATRLMQDKAVVINLHKLDDSSKQRVIDILFGVCYALNGDLKTIDTNVFLCTPSSVGVQGTILSEE